jgi:hypothetical protein
VKEESGYEIVVRMVAAVQDRDKHGHPPIAYHEYKFFFLGVLCGGKAEHLIKTSGSEFFAEDELPTHSLSCVTLTQLKHMFGTIEILSGQLLSTEK